MSVKLYSTLQIQCFVRGFPKLEVTWTNDGKLLDTRTRSRLIEWLMAMLVNTNAALKAVKEKMKQLFILQLQVNVDLLFSFCCSSHFLLFFLNFHLFLILFVNSILRSSWNQSWAQESIGYIWFIASVQMLCKRLPFTKGTLD